MELHEKLQKQLHEIIEILNIQVMQEIIEKKH